MYGYTTHQSPWQRLQPSEKTATPAKSTQTNGPSVGLRFSTVLRILWTAFWFLIYSAITSIVQATLLVLAVVAVPILLFVVVGLIGLVVHIVSLLFPGA